MAMQALAWDDEPEKYFNLLAKHLQPLGIDLTITTDPDDFAAKFNDPANHWDLVITDLVRSGYPAAHDKKPDAGVQIAKGIHNVPVFMVTIHQNRFDLPKLGVPSHVIVKSKSTPPGFQAAEIRDELRRRGLFTDSRKIFLIYGHDHSAPRTSADIRARYSGKGSGLKILEIAPDNLFSEINQGLVERMHDCAAVIAVCTPDDKVEARGKSEGAIETEIYYQPRQNVLYEMGMALGLARGLKRLIIIQKKGPTPDQHARLPSDLGGVIPLRFEKNVDEIFDSLDARLRELRVDLD